MARTSPEFAINLFAIVSTLSRTPQTAAAIAARAGVHPRTVARALAKLRELGVDVRVAEPVATAGRGRPAARYFLARLADRSKVPRPRSSGAPGLDPGRRDALRAAQGYRRTALDRGQRLAAAAKLLVELPGWEQFLTDAKFHERRRRQVSRAMMEATSVAELEHLPRLARELVNALGALETSLARVQLGTPSTSGDSG